MKLTSKDNKTIKLILDEINNNPTYYKLFNHHNQKHNLKELIRCIIIILKLGISYRNIEPYTNIHWNIIYKFKLKLAKYNIFQLIFNKYKNEYINELNDDISLLYTDTTFILNKNGQELVDYNPLVKKHKTTKVSIITDNFNNPISVGVYKSTIHDSKIIKTQLDTLYTESPILFDNTKTLVCDSAYDSKSLEDKVKSLKLKQLIRCKNKRNSKKYYKYTLKEKVILGERINVEHKFAMYKQYNKLYKRTDRQLITFSSYLFLASLIIIDKL